jgi:protein SCO1/2
MKSRDVGKALGAALAAPLLVACAAGGSGRGSDRFAQGAIVISHVVAVEPVAAGAPSGATVAVYLSIANQGEIADTLDAVDSPGVSRALVHGQTAHDGMTMMMPVAAVPVPAHGVVRLAPGGMHVMLEGVGRRVVAGDTVPLELVFRHAGRLAVRARVVKYADLERSLPAAATSAGQDPALRLTRSDGAVFDLGEQRGKVVVVFFGYTHCPDLCPLTLANFAWVRRRLGPRAALVRFVFVTVDPRRDSPAGAMAYARQFDSSFIGLSGDSATLAAAQRAFHVASWVTRDSAGNVVVAHSASVFVVGRDGAVARVLAHDMADVDGLYAAVSRALGS